MERANLSPGALALASLFNTCIECFECFSGGDQRPEDSELLLTKLDIQRERMLTWGDLIGISKSKDEGRCAILDEKEDLIQKNLTALHRLFTHASKLEAEYGVRALQTQSPTDKFNHLSSTRAKTLKRSYAQIRAAIQDQKSTPRQRTRWTIQDTKKFELYLNNITDFVDELQQSAPIDSREQDALIYKDIAQLTIPELRTVQDACEGRYKAWSDVASAILAASEAGSVTHRTIAEWVHETNAGEDEFGQPILNPELRANLNRAFKKFDLSLSTNTYVYFMFTGGCFLRGTDDHCKYSTLGLMTFKTDGESFFPGPAAPLNTKWSPTRRISESMKVSTSGAMYVYCGLCSCALRTALSICQSQDIEIIECFVRVDDRISTCCLGEDSPRNRLMSLMHTLKQIESMPRPDLNGYNANQIGFMDRVWLEQRIYQLEEEFVDEGSTKDRRDRGAELFEELTDSAADRTAIVVLGELDACQWMIHMPPFPWTPRMPKETEIYQLLGSPNWKRVYLGTYTPRHYHLSTADSRRELARSGRSDYSAPSPSGQPRTLATGNGVLTPRPQEDLYDASISADRIPNPTVLQPSEAIETR